MLYGVILVLMLMGFLVLWRIPVCTRQSVNLPALPTLSIIVPARNEEENLPVLLSSLNSQSRVPTEIIVVDDHSTDATAACAAANGAIVLAAKPLPKGWVGKAWACYQGAEASSGEVLLFLDADITVEPGGLEMMYSTFLSRSGVLSVGPWHRTKKLYEELSAWFNVMIMAGMNAFTIRGRRVRPSGLFGPSMMIRREDYFRCGGHAAVKDKILENLFLGDIFREAGLDLHLFGGRGSLSFRMYPDGLSQLIEGWSKAFATGAGKTSPVTMFFIVAWMSGAIMAMTGTLVSLTRGDVSGVVASSTLYLAFVGQIYWMLRRVGSFRFVTALFYPVSLFFFFYVFSRSIIMVKFRKNVAWKARSIDLEKD